MYGLHSLTRGRVARLVWAGCCVAMLASTGLAQDYDLDNVSGELVAKPSTAAAVTVTEDNFGSFNLPFSFPYYGKEYTKAFPCDNGFILLGNGSKPSSYGYWYNTGFPTTSGGSNTDGMIGPLWNDYSNYSPYGNGIYTWTSGSAPNRICFIHYDAVSPYVSTTPDMTFQVQLFETSGKIVFAYPSTSTTAGQNWQASASIGIDEPAGSRFVSPSASKTNYANPGTDYKFSPEITRISGEVSIANVVSDDSGIGNSSAAAIAAAGLKAELRTGAVTNASAILDADGAFEVQGVALDSSQSGSVVLVSDTLACRVSPSTVDTQVPAFATSIETGVSYGEDTTISDFVLGDANDESGSARAPMQIAAHINAIRTWVQSVTGADIPKLEVFYDESSGSPSRYTPAGQTTAPNLRIGSSSATNPDAFDGAIVARLYMRHVLATLTGATPAAFNRDLDAATSEDAAFADALGLYAHAFVTGETTIYDGISASSTVAFDLETPDLTRSPAPDVAGWAAAALFDLQDAANEDHDVVDGTVGANAAKPIEAAGDITGAATPASFLDAWVNDGNSGSDLVTDFIRHGLLPDDANEPNDTRDLAQFLGTAGVRTTGLTLNRYNEDWFEVDVAQDAPLFFVEIGFNRFEIVAEMTLEVYDAGGTLLNFGVPDGQNGPIVATLPNLNAGSIFIRVAHDAGATIPDYDLQAYAQMSVALSSAPAWTVGRRIQEPLDLRGGIPPYSVIAKDGSGDLFTQIQFLPSATPAPFDMIWTPQDVGTTNIQIVVTDAGEPTHSRTLNLAFIVNAELAFSAPELTGVALNKLADVNLGRIGGTDPISLSDEFGELPGGLSVDPDFHIRGTASEPGGGAFGFRATDVAGSESSVDSFLVVCVPIDRAKQPVPLAEGQAAAGFYFDALSGSVCSMKLKTSKKQAKRELNFLVIGPDGNVVQGGSAKVKAGKVTLKNMPLPTTGRYFIAFASDDGGAATELQGTLKLVLPKKSKESIERMELDELYKVEFGALEGATLNVKGKTTEGMEVRVVFIIRPNGEVIPFNDVTVENNKGKVKITTEPLPEDGTYQLYLAPLKTDLADFNFKYVIKQPKGKVFSIDD